MPAWYSSDEGRRQVTFRRQLRDFPSDKASVRDRNSMLVELHLYYTRNDAYGNLWKRYGICMTFSEQPFCTRT